MANMSYCQFQNTVQDFRDCLEVVEDLNPRSYARMNEDERYALKRLLKLAVNFASYEEELETFLNMPENILKELADSYE